MAATLLAAHQRVAGAPNVTKQDVQHLPIRRISAHARREKSIRHGHISTLHIWWARRPLAAFRAVICAALWPDPADENCPAAFRQQARAWMLQWTTHERQNLLSAESRPRFEAARLNARRRHPRTKAPAPD